MKNTLFLLGCCIISGTAFAQSEPDSIHIVMHENQNGNMRTLDTIVPLSQQQVLFVWMEDNGWQAPPPPPPPGMEPMQIEIVMDGDSAGMPPAGGEHRQMMYVRMEGDSGVMPPPPPGCQMRFIQTDGEPSSDGNVMIRRGPCPPPPPPGSDVEMTVTEKDTVINGETRKMIIRTERIILPEGVQAPPVPPVPPIAPVPPVPPTPPSGNKKQPAPAEHQKQLVVYPNPSSAVINVEFDVNGNEKTTLRVIDMNGKVVYTEEIVENESKHVTREINLGGKGKGTYTVEVKTDKKVIAERVIIQ